MEGWPLVESQDAWAKTCEDSERNYKAGAFLIERLGAARHVDPTLMATLWGLRQTLLAENGPPSAATAMLVDLTILAYYNALRIQGWIGDLATLIEHEFFGQASPTAKLRAKHGKDVGALVVEDHVKRLGEQLLPLLERANRMVLRNVKAIRELRQGPVPTVPIARAEQVNVASQQVNTASVD